MFIQTGITVFNAIFKLFLLIVKSYGGDTQSVSAMMLIQYLIFILMIPFWIAVWQFINL